MSEFLRAGAQRRHVRTVLAVLAAGLTAWLLTGHGVTAPRLGFPTKETDPEPVTVTHEDSSTSSSGGAPHTGKDTPAALLSAELRRAWTRRPDSPLPTASAEDVAAKLQPLRCPRPDPTTTTTTTTTSSSDHAADARHHSCGADAAAARQGCEACAARYPGARRVLSPFGVSEFSHVARTKAQARSFVPIFADLDAEVAAITAPGGRVVVDIGYTGDEDAAWMAEVYFKEAQRKQTALHIYEPNPVTFAKVRSRIQKNRHPGKVTLHNKGLGRTDGSQMFWFNKDGSRSSFQRVRSDDYEQVPITKNVSRLDSLPLTHQDVVIPFVKLSAGRWEREVLSGGEEFLKKAAVVLADISPVPNNSRIVETLSQNGFVVYALGCGSLARIHQTRAWWWSPVVAVKPFLAPIADAHACWDFSESPYVCGSPQAAAHAPVGCHNASDPNPFSLVSLPYDPDTEPVFSTAMSSPDTHRMLKIVFCSFIVFTIAVLGYSVIVPVVLTMCSYLKAVIE